MDSADRDLLLALADFVYAGWGSTADRNVINRHLARVKETADTVRRLMAEPDFRDGSAIELAKIPPRVPVISAPRHRQP